MSGDRLFAKTVAWMPRANGPECGTNRDLGRGFSGDREQIFHLRGVPVAERLVGEEVRVTQRVMGRLLGRAARSGASGDGGHVKFRFDESRAHERRGGQGDRGGETARMRDASGSFAGVFRVQFGKAAGELREEVRSGVGIP